MEREANRSTPERSEERRRLAAEAPLRADVRLLGEMLGAAIRSQHGGPLLARVEQVRKLARRLRQQPGASPASADASPRQTPRQPGLQLEALLDGLPLEEKRTLARAFTTFFFLANVAENHHRVRRRQDHA